MKKIVSFILIICTLCAICICFSGCELEEEKVKDNYDIVFCENFEGRFVPIGKDRVIFDDGYREPTVRYFYDKYTKVVYYYFITSSAFGPQPLYNADGTFVTYDSLSK